MRLVLPLVLLSVAATACTSAPAPDQPEAAAVTVESAPVTEADWPAVIEAGGVVLARDTATVASRVLAPVASVRVRPGDRVRRGETLVVLDAPDLGAQATRGTEAATAAEHAAVAAAAELKAAEGGLVLARATHTRITALFNDRSATRQELDEAQTALVAAEARRAAADARVAESRAGLEAARAAGRAGVITAGFAVLTAPFDGVVTGRSVDPGSMATPGMPLLVVEDTRAFRLEVRLDATRVPLVRVGQTVSVRLDAAGADAAWIDGRVAEVSRIDPAGHSFAAKIDLPANPSWRSGLFGRARLVGPSRRVLSVPDAAILQRGQLNYVFVVSSDGVARLRAVSTGSADKGRVEVLDGLTAGEVVIAPVPATLKDGSKVSRGAGR